MSQEVSSQDKASDFSHISPTALGVAFCRKFTDIPFAAEIANQVSTKELTEWALDSNDATGRLILAMEARYKCMISAIQRLGIKQVLEFAAGLSFRGLVMTEDPSVVYVETDLAGIMEEKLSILNKVPHMGDRAANGRVFFHTVNALEFNQIEKALAHFDPSEPVAVIHEGFYPYLSMAEKDQLASNIHRILSRFGGAWITPDLTTEGDMNSIFGTQFGKKGVDIHAEVTKMTGRDFRDRIFENEDHVNSFFEQRGFNISVMPQIDGTYTLSSLSHHENAATEADELRNILKVWILTLNSK